MIYTIIAVLVVAGSVYWAYTLGLLHKQIIWVGILCISAALLLYLQPLLARLGVSFDSYPISVAISYKYISTLVYPFIVVPLATLALPLLSRRGKREVTAELLLLEKKLGLR